MFPSNGSLLYFFLSFFVLLFCFFVLQSCFFVLIFVIKRLKSLFALFVFLYACFWTGTKKVSFILLRCEAPNCPPNSQVKLTASPPWAFICFPWSLVTKLFGFRSSKYRNNAEVSHKNQSNAKNSFSLCFSTIIMSNEISLFCTKQISVAKIYTII